MINLEDLAKAFPMEGLETFTGIITADVEAKTRLSTIEKENYDKVKMSGAMQVENIVYKSEGLPKVQIKEADMQFSPQRVNLKSFNANLGKSDIQGSGTIDNILAYFSPEKTMTGDLKLRSNYFNVDEWMESEEETTTISDPTPESLDYEVFDRFDFKVDAEAKKIDYDVYELRNTSLVGQMSPSRMKIADFDSQIGKSDLSGSGEITNVMDYVFDNETLGGKLKFRSGFLDLNQFMTEDGTSTGTSTGDEMELEAILVPANIDMTIDAKIGEVLYDNMRLRDVTGDLIIENEAVVLDDVKAEALGGDITMSGGYDTKDRENPAFNIKYDLQKLNFSDAFKALNTFQTLAPIGEFIEGNFTTSLIMDGTLGKDLIPKIGNLNAQGYLQTLNAFISNFKPLQAVGNALQVKEFTEKLKIKGTKNWFEIKDGRVEVKEFDYAVKDIDLKISGMHALTQDMEYKIKAKIPRKLMESNAYGAAASSGLDALTKEANKLGLNLKKSEFINVMVNLNGSIKDPKVKFKLLGGEGEATLAEAAEDQVKEELNQKKEELVKAGQEKLEDKKEEVKATVEAKAAEEIDKAKEQAEAKVKEEQKKLEEKIGKEAESKATEILGEKGKEEADKIKNELEKFNPFKKKKKKDGN